MKRDESDLQGPFLFITGKLAEPALRELLKQLSEELHFRYEVLVLPISVAALMSVSWIGRKLQIPASSADFQKVILPGWTQGNVAKLESQFQIPFERGPKDLFDLPQHFGQEKTRVHDWNHYDIEILAEINHAPRLSMRKLIEQAAHYRDHGADIIDLGCIPGEIWKEIGQATRELRNEGFRISVDSFHQSEVERAVEAGAELVLSCNSSNIHWAKDIETSWVVIPDDPAHNPHWLEEFEAIFEELNHEGRKIILDPILEPIGFGFAQSLARYYSVRERWPQTEMMMGIGNLTELTEVDSAGINMLLACFCQELNIHQVLTTEVINWARSSVAELDFARRMVSYSLSNKVLPKHLDSRLVMLRDSQKNSMGAHNLLQLADSIRDRNYRIFVEAGEIHMMNHRGYWKARDAYILFEEILKSDADLDATHAFYLGYELAKAVTALTLDKQYRQDQALCWGMLTVPEESAHECCKRKAKENSDSLSSSGNVDRDKTDGLQVEDKSEKEHKA